MKKLSSYGLIALAGLSLAGCTQAQLDRYTGAALATASVLKTIGKDIVAFDCANADLIYVIAKDAGAKGRVVDALDRNRSIAADACPALTGSPAIVVQVGSVVK